MTSGSFGTSAVLAGAGLLEGWAIDSAFLRRRHDSHGCRFSH